MLQLPGPRARSAFRIAKLLEQLRALSSAVTGLDAGFVHFVDLAESLTAAERVILDALLSYGPREPHVSDDSGAQVLVVPRAGTISPWSSKATDIAHVCGLGSVRRIERGISYRLRSAQPLGKEHLALLAPALHDRMTEAALLDPAGAARLFEHAQPQPFARVA